MSAAGLLRGRFLCCEVGLGLWGEGRILKGGGRGGGIGGMRFYWFYWGHCIYVVSFLCCFVVCILFNFENRNFVILFLKKNGFVKHGFVINLTGFFIISATNIP